MSLTGNKRAKSNYSASAYDEVLRTTTAFQLAQFVNVK